MRIFAIATPKSGLARVSGKYISPLNEEFNAEPINNKIEQFWAKVRGVLGTVGVLGIVVVVLRWAGVTTSVESIQALLESGDALVEAAILLISALSLVVERASEAFANE